jgi:peptide/nickel transport system permease protein
MAVVRRADPADLAGLRAAEEPRSTTRGRLRRWLPITIGVALAVTMIVIAAAAPLIAPLSPSAQYSDAVLKGPGAVERHFLGTDEFGRDLLSRIIWGARVSLEVGLVSVAFAFALGVPLGIVAGVIGGRVEMLIMRGSDMLMAFPTLLLALIIVTALGGTLVNEMLAIGVALTPNFVRLARSLALTIREQDYILAARALGGGQVRVMARHVFPNALYALVVVATLYIATAIRTEASLSFLGARHHGGGARLQPDGRRPARPARPAPQGRVAPRAIGPESSELPLQQAEDSLVEESCWTERQLHPNR